MNERTLRLLLDDVAAGRMPPADAARRLQVMPFEDLGFARVDHHRALRQGMAEVIYAPGKTAAEVAGIAAAVARESPNLLITRADADTFARVRASLPEVEFQPRCGAIRLRRQPPPPGRGTVLVLSAGTADLAVAEEAAFTAETMTAPVERIPDVGVAGLHRLLAELPRLRAATVLIVVAGMEGALPSVVAGLVAAPVIAVPTSVGYGSNLGGLAALLAMLNSCASNVTVVNVDNGFGAGFVAAAINRRGEGDDVPRPGR